MGKQSPREIVNMGCVLMSCTLRRTQIHKKSASRMHAFSSYCVHRHHHMIWLSSECCTFATQVRFVPCERKISPRVMTRYACASAVTRTLACELQLLQKHFRKGPRRVSCLCCWHVQDFFWQPENDKKLSWFVDLSFGGYRAGRHLNLYHRDTKWEKVIYWA